METIVCTVPAIHDRDVLETVSHLIGLSSSDHRLTVIVYESVSSFGYVNPEVAFPGFDRSRHTYLYLHGDDAPGAYPARRRISEFVSDKGIGGTYALCLDSHVRFRGNWDRELVELYKNAPTTWLGVDVTQPVLSAFGSRDLYGEAWEDMVTVTQYQKEWRICVPELACEIYRRPPGVTYTPARHLSACTAFGPISLLHLWSKHPETVKFLGEEHLLAYEIYRQGWGQFHCRMPMAQLMLRPPGRPWEVDPQWFEKEKDSYGYLRKALHIDLATCDANCLPADGGRICDMERYQALVGLSFRGRCEIPDSPFWRWMDAHFPEGSVHAGRANWPEPLNAPLEGSQA